MKKFLLLLLVFASPLYAEKSWFVVDYKSVVNDEDVSSRSFDFKGLTITADQFTVGFVDTKNALIVIKDTPANLTKFKSKLTFVCSNEDKDVKTITKAKAVKMGAKKSWYCKKYELY